MHGLVDRGNYELRYVLKNRKTDEVYFVVVFILVPFEENMSSELEKAGNPYTFAERKWEAHA